MYSSSCWLHADLSFFNISVSIFMLISALSSFFSIKFPFSSSTLCFLSSSYSSSSSSLSLLSLNSAVTLCLISNNVLTSFASCLFFSDILSSPEVPPPLLESDVFGLPDKLTNISATVVSRSCLVSFAFYKKIVSSNKVSNFLISPPPARILSLIAWVQVVFSSFLLCFLRANDFVLGFSYITLIKFIFPILNQWCLPSLKSIFLRKPLSLTSILSHAVLCYWVRFKRLNIIHIIASSIWSNIIAQRSYVMTPLTSDVHFVPRLGLEPRIQNQYQCNFETATWSK